MVVLPIRPDEDLMGIAAGSVRDKDRVARFEREIREPLAVVRPGHVDGVVGQKDARRAAEERHKPQAAASRTVDPDFGTVA